MISAMGYFLENIRSKRSSAKLSQAEAGEIAGVTRENYNSFENGRRSLPDEGLERLLKRLGISTEDVETWKILDSASDEALFNAAKELFARDPEKAARIKKMVEEQMKDGSL